MAAEHLEKAYRLRERVSEREKYRIAAYYHHAFTGELEQARPIYDLWKGNYPRDLAPYLNLGLCHSWLGEYEKAAAVTAEALRLDPGNVLSYSNLAAFQIKLELAGLGELISNWSIPNTCGHQGGIDEAGVRY